MTAPFDDSLDIDEPPEGRVHGHRRRVQLADSSPKGRVRLDALARMLQDVSDEDTTDAGFPPEEPWVVRRAALRVDVFPTFRDEVDVATWCSGIGGRWAERRVRIRSVHGPEHGSVDAAVLWVHLDTDGRPARLPARFGDLYGGAARGRKVRARLRHDPRPDDPAATDRRAFPLRLTDFDLMGHVNNAVSWIPLEDTLIGLDERAPLLASVEHPASLDVGADPAVLVATLDAAAGERAPGRDLWVVDGDTVCSTGRLRFPA